MSLRLRSELRRRWPSLLALAVVIALSGAVVLTALAGARRTHRSVSDFQRYDGSPEGLVAFPKFNSNDGVDTVLHDPTVKRGAVGMMMSALPYQPGNPNYMPLIAAADDQFGKHIFRGLLLDGRRLRDDATDEILLSEGDARLLNAKVGDRVPLLAFSAGEADRCLRSELGGALCDKLARTPKLSVRVVGIVRTDIDVTQRTQDVGFSLLSRGFYERHRSDIGWTPFVLVQLRTGVTSEQFTARIRNALGADNPADVQPATGQAAYDTVGVLSTGLVLFALVAAVAAAFAIGQAVVRQVVAGSDERTTLAALGVTRAGRVVDAGTPVVVAALLGAGLAVMGAYLGSRFMPIGFARRIEPYQGFDFDPVVLGVGLVILVGFVAVVAMFSALLADRRHERAHAVAIRVGARAAEMPLSPSATVGLRHAFAGPRDSVPVRSAAIGIAAAVAGVIAVLSFSASLHHLTRTPALYGWSWNAMDVDQRYADALRADRDIDAIALVARRAPLRIGSSAEDAQPELGMAITPQQGEMPAAIVRGRAPARDDEVALGADSLSVTHRNIGDAINIFGARGDLHATIVGVAVYPTDEDGDPIARGVLLTPGALNRVAKRTNSGGESLYPEGYAVRFRADVDRAAALRRLEQLAPSDNPGRTSFSLPEPPAEVDKLRQVESLPIVLALFLAALGALAMGHALIVAVRRRARDFAVLRALGFRQRDVRRSVAYEASALALVGACIGVPLGVLLGRYAWSRVADSVGVRIVDRVPPAALLTIVPCVIVVAVVLAVIPGRRAARQHPSAILRTE